MKKNNILNCSLVNITNRELLQCLTRGILYTPNIDHFVLLQTDHEFYHAYKNADYVTLDSQIVYFLSKVSGRPFQEKIAGSDFFPLFCEYHKNNPRIKIFVLGGLDGVSGKVKKILNTRIGREIIVDAYSPGLDFEKDEIECKAIIERINNSVANVLVVGLGTPKQEKWIYRYKSKLPAIDIFMGVGATLDFIAGKQRRAPVFLQKVGLEWAFRLIQHPRKFMYRYLIRDVSFFYYFLLDRLKLYKNPFAELE